jgi:hypothetical protein
LPTSGVTYVLIPAGADAVLRGIEGIRFFPEILVEPVGTALAVLAFEDGLPRASLHGAGNFRPGQIEQRGREIYVENHGIEAGAGSDQRRIPHQERHPDRILVHGALVLQAVFALEITVVRSENNDGVVQLAGFRQEIENLAHTFVYRHETGGDAALPLAVSSHLEFGQRLKQAFDAVPGLPSHGKIGRSPVVGVVPGFGQRKPFVIEQVSVLRLGLPGSVHGFVACEQCERFSGVPLLEKLQSEAVDVIGNIALGGSLLSVDDEGVIEVNSLTGEAGVVIEPVLALEKSRHVNLSDVGRGVADLPQQRADGRDAVAHEARVAVVGHPGRVGIEAGQIRGAAGRAQRGGHEGVSEHGALAHQTVHIRCLQPGLATQGRHRIPALIVGVDENEVGPSPLGALEQKGRNGLSEHGATRRLHTRLRYHFVGAGRRRCDEAALSASLSVLPVHSPAGRRHAGTNKETLLRP